jgi:hypothetical protein
MPRRHEILVESWNGRAWSNVATPVLTGGDAGPPSPSFNSVSCVSAGFCVAVGEIREFNMGTRCCHRPLIESWNGREWSMVPNPAGLPYASLADASCVSSRFCAAVGSNNGGDGGGPPRTLMESWNGRAWSLLPSPNPGNLDEPRGVSCVSVMFCVAVGLEFSPGKGGDYPLIESWNGAEWSVVPKPNNEGALNGVSCVSAKRCVAVGWSHTGTLVETWNGSTWSVLESPNPEGGGVPELRGVSCVSAGSCAAVGSDSTEAGPSQTLVETSKGSKWAIIPSANSASGVSYLDGVSCASTQSCFAVGEDETTPKGPSQALVEAGAIHPWGGFGFSRF